MKKLFTFFVLLAASGLLAQPTFQYSNTVSTTAGITATVLIGGKPSSSGGTGANVTWNFSSLTFTPAGTATIMSPTATPYGSSFPTANWAAMIVAGTNTVYSYNNVQPTYQDQLGDNISATGGSTYTPDPKRHLIFPFNFGNSYTDSYQCISCSPGSFTVTYDAYGTLIVNGKTYNNVARVTNMFGYPYYNYYSTNPIVSIFAYDTSPTSGPTSVLIESNILSGIKENYVVSHMNVFPNPATGFVKIENNNFVTVEVEIFDILGKRVKDKQLLSQGETTTIDVSSFPKGMYFLKYKDEFNNDSFTKLIVE